MNFKDINLMSESDAKNAFMQCCTSSIWVHKMVQSRPFNDLNSLFEAANLHWLDLTEADYLEAFDGHPKIGNVNSLVKKYADTKTLAAGEQSGMNAANELTIKALAKGNDDYLSKFGFIFIVCATGKSAAQMLALLQKRIINDRETELENAAEEQRKIFHIRLNKYA
jgi:2-oxo-4-hydroxy-4-carboxy-5-ureidoimidazoline decarboxylase